MRFSLKIASLATVLGALAGCKSGLPRPDYTVHASPPAFRIGPDGLRIDNAGYRLDAEGYRIDARGKRIGLVPPTRESSTDAVAGYWIAEQ